MPKPVEPPEPKRPDVPPGQENRPPDAPPPPGQENRPENPGPPPKPNQDLPKPEH